MKAKPKSRRDSDWVEMLDELGPGETRRRIIIAIQAETLLMSAAESAGIDWCIKMLQRAKSNDNVESILEMIIPK
jgi:hypothetical protein